MRAGVQRAAGFQQQFPRLAGVCAVPEETVHHLLVLPEDREQQQAPLLRIIVQVVIQQLFRWDSPARVFASNMRARAAVMRSRCFCRRRVLFWWTATWMGARVFLECVRVETSIFPHSVFCER